MGFIDVHAHLDMLEGTTDEVIQMAAVNGVDKIVTIGTEPADLPIVLNIAKKYYPKVFCTLGIHPHHGAVWTEEVEKYLLQYTQEKEVIAIGEIGLDYYYKNSAPEEQKMTFRKQLELAAKLKMPVEIHTRDAEEDTFEILNEFKGKVTGLIHCFTSSQELAKKCLDLGYNISFSGVVTFKNADSLRDTLKFVPLDRLHVETDAPFLAPVPERGKKNTPAYVIHTAQKVADLKSISLEKLCEITNENARQLFPKLIW